MSEGADNDFYNQVPALPSDECLYVPNGVPCPAKRTLEGLKKQILEAVKREGKSTSVSFLLSDQQ